MALTIFGDVGFALQTHGVWFLADRPIKWRNSKASVLKAFVVADATIWRYRFQGLVRQESSSSFAVCYLPRLPLYDAH